MRGRRRPLPRRSRLGSTSDLPDAVPVATTTDSPRPEPVQGLGLVAPQRIDAEPLPDFVGERVDEQPHAARAGRLMFDVHELALARERLEQVLEHLPHPASGVSSYREASMDLAIQVYAKDDWQVVIVAGEVDVATAPRLHDRLVGLASDGHRRLAVDLEGVTMLDWMGLGALLGVLARVRSLGGEMVVLSPSPATRELLALTDLDRVLPIRDRLALSEP